MNKKLCRSRTDRMLGGVCGGLGAYVGIDPIIVRVIFAVFTIAYGIGVPVYVALWFLIPLEGRVSDQQEGEGGGLSADEAGTRFRHMAGEFGEAVRRPNPQAVLIGGIALVITGGLWLLRSLGLPWLRWLDADLFWPCVLILAGVVVIVRMLKGGSRG